MSVYLHDIPLPQAQARLEEALKSVGLWGPLGSEEIALDENATGRVLSKPVWAKMSSPHYHASAMDGFALRAEDTDGAMPNTPITLNTERQAMYVDTGDPLPPWADAVIPIENVEALDEGDRLSEDIRQPKTIRIRSSVTPWSHVRPMGEDIVATQLVLPAGHSLRPIDLGAIAACGHDRVFVNRKPKVAILPTGAELVEVGQPVKMGQIIEYNSIVMAAQVKAWGGEPARFPITTDNYEIICDRVREAAENHDLVLLNAGSSAGSEDFSAQVVECLGELLVHGVAVRPGHPVILGMLNRGEGERRTPIIGVPGYPVSAALTCEIFVAPLIALWQGVKPPETTTVQANLTRKVTSPPGDDDFMRVALGRVGGRLLAAPLSRGAGVITSLVRADGIALLPRGSQGLSAGEEISVRLYRRLDEIERTIFAIGSHDITLDLIAQFLSEKNSRLTSANVGSLGGLVALRRAEAHLAGSHLLDPLTGEYNLSYIRQYLPDTPVKVVALVGREQGLLVKKGNPKRINSLADLVKPEIIFVNRQRGAGTRVLLDYHLGLESIPIDEIRGYEREEYTHLAVAAAIASGRADSGLGIAAAAQALELDFIPLFQERYDLVIPQEFARDRLLEPLFQVIEDPGFRKAVAELPGYDIGPMGTLIAEIG
jgi:putative molybdopterin biosynthesis protein